MHRFHNHAKHRHRQTLSVCASALQPVLGADHPVVPANVSSQKLRDHFVGMRGCGAFARLAASRFRRAGGIQPLPPLRSHGPGTARPRGRQAVPCHGQLASLHAKPRAGLPFATHRRIQRLPGRIGSRVAQMRHPHSGRGTVSAGPFSGRLCHPQQRPSFEPDGWGRVSRAFGGQTARSLAATRQRGGASGFCPLLLRRRPRCSHHTGLAGNRSPTVLAAAEPSAPPRSDS